MKNSIVFISILILLAILFLSFVTNQQERFYYAYERKIPLYEVDNKFIIRFSPDQDKKQMKALLNKAAPQSKVIQWAEKNTVILKAPSRKRQNSALSKFQQERINKSVISVHPLYKGEKGAEMGLTDEIQVRFREGIAQSEIQNIFKKYNLSLVRETEYYKLLRVTPPQ
jgi:hypothetical protein